MTATNQVWAIIPARGGSKSIPLKNLYEFGGRPLLWYVTDALRRCATVDRIMCSTEDGRISAYCDEIGLEVHHRPENLARDDTPVTETVLHLVADMEEREGVRPEIIVLGQPTSPLLLAEHVDDCVRALQADPRAASAQTVVEIPHHHNYVNQRVIEDGYVRFNFEMERLEKFNKQLKPKTYALGNLVATRTEDLIRSGQFFAKPSIPIPIPRLYALDVDTYEDLELGELYLAKLERDRSGRGD